MTATTATVDRLDADVARYVDALLARYRTLAPMGQVACPACNGGGQSISACGHLARCTTCVGSGHVDGSYRERLAIGESIADIRRAGDYSLREFASMIGVKPFELSDVENGRALG